MERAINNKGDTLYTIIYPNEGKETVILLHGGPGFPDELSDVVDILKNKYQIITFHQRGTRKSPCMSGDLSMDAHVSDIEVIAACFGVERFHLFGHSWGGLYAQIYAQCHPERLLSLFLCNPGSGTGAEWKQTEREVLRSNRSKCTLWEWAGMGMNSLLGLIGSDKAARRLFRQVMKNYNKGFTADYDPGAAVRNLTAAAANKTRMEIAKYPLLKPMTDPIFPITIVYGDKDIYESSKEFVLMRYPTAKVITIENCGHLPWLHNPVRFKEILKEAYGS